MSTSPPAIIDTQDVVPETIGTLKTQFKVEIGTRFLEHFSESLYSSPQKAFEELISNGWDAGASYVDVRIPSDLHDPKASMCVLDNGASMDEAGLKALWHIAFSPKKDRTEEHGRRLIGKFGIGKLATYVLANKLTYLCKATDGKIRRVTMDYGTLDLQAEAAPDRLISEIPLEIFEVQESDVEKALTHVHGGTELYKIIKGGVQPPANTFLEDEFGGDKADFKPPKSGTWTLVVLSDLKPTGRALKIGVLRRMLRAALPLGSEMVIAVNEKALVSSKIDKPVIQEWAIGPDLEITEVIVPEESSASTDSAPLRSVVPDDDSNANGSSRPVATRLKTEPSQKRNQSKGLKVSVTSEKLPVPSVTLPGIGRITGKVRLFENEITGGISEEVGSSNGFYVNVLGRIVNQQDPSFGEENLSHSAWARFRMAVRVDGLNPFLTTSREQFKVKPELLLFKAFLRTVFNKARTLYDNEKYAELHAGGDALVQSLGVVSLYSLRNVVSETLLGEQPPLPGLFDDSNIPDRKQKLDDWKKSTGDNLRHALNDVKYEKSDDQSLAKFRLSDNTIVVNKDHPFVLEHGRSKAEKQLVRTVAMVNLLTDVYALDIGIKPSILTEIREYRDRLMRYQAIAKRESGVYIASLLLESQNQSDESRRFELVLYDALRVLGFEVTEKGEKGEPEGIAKAFPFPTNRQDSGGEIAPLYSFTFDAKSSTKATVQTGNIHLDGVVEHRQRYKADYALTVAPGYSGDAVTTRCTQQKVTPITAHSLGKLLEYTMEYGAIGLNKLREMFELYDHNAVSKWVADLGTWLQDQRTLTIDIFLRALKGLEGKIPDTLSPSLLAYQCREVLKVRKVTDKDVLSLAQGLHILAPDLIDVQKDNIIINATTERLAQMVAAQLDKLGKDEPK